MEITDVDVFPVNMDVVDLDDGGIAPYVSCRGAVQDVDRILVRVTTDDGISGWGEMRVFLSPEATVSILEDGIAPIVLGRSPFEVEGLRRSIFIEYTNAKMFFAPIEIACWDIVGKALDKPVYELLGGWTAPSQTSRRGDASVDVTDAVPVAYCVGILSPEDSADHAVTALNRGYGVLKTKAGLDWREDVERVVAMHEAVDGQLEFRLDPNQGWRLDEAVRVGAKLADAGVYVQYLEQPIRVDSHESLRLLRERLPQPIGPNEDTYIEHNLGELVRRGALDVGVVDMTPAGGITGLRQLAAIAEDAGVPLAHHCAFDLGVRTAAILHAVAGIPGFSLPPDTVYYAWEDDVITSPFEIRDGEIELPDGPGLGVEVSESKLAEYGL